MLPTLQLTGRAYLYSKPSAQDARRRPFCFLLPRKPCTRRALSPCSPLPCTSPPRSLPHTRGVAPSQTPSPSSSSRRPMSPSKNARAGSGQSQRPRSAATTLTRCCARARGATARRRQSRSFCSARARAARAQRSNVRPSMSFIPCHHPYQLGRDVLASRKHSCAIFQHWSSISLRASPKFQFALMARVHRCLMSAGLARQGPR